MLSEEKKKKKKKAVAFAPISRCIKHPIFTIAFAKIEQHLHHLSLLAPFPWYKISFSVFVAPYFTPAPKVDKQINEQGGNEINYGNVVSREDYISAPDLK